MSYVLRSVCIQWRPEARASESHLNASQTIGVRLILSASDCMVKRPKD